MENGDKAFGRLLFAPPPWILAIGFVFAAWGLWNLRLNNEDVLRWLPDRSAARDDHRRFQATFGSDDFVVVSWEGCRVDDPRLGEFADHLRKSDPAGLVQSVRTGKEVLDQLVASGGFTDREVRQRLAGIFFGVRDPELSCCVIELSPAGTANRSGARQTIEAAIGQTPGLLADQMMIAGYPWILTTMNQMIGRMFQRLLVVSAVASTLMALLCFSNFRLALLGLVAAGSAAGFSVGAVPALGGTFGGLTMIVPTLAFVMTMSGAVHLTRYAIDSIGDYGQLMRKGWLPVSVSALTTILGVLSLLASHYPAVREFGSCCALSMTYSWIVQLTVVPWLLVRWGRPGLVALRDRTDQGWFGSRFLRGLVLVRWPLFLLTALLTAGGITGLYRLKANVEAENLFRSDAPILVGIRNLEAQLGPMEQTELMLVFPQPTEADWLRRVQFVRQLGVLLKRLPGVATVHSLADWIPDSRQGSGVLRQTRRQMLKDRSWNSRSELGASGMFRADKGEEAWRISLRFPFSEPADFGGMEARVLELCRRLDAEVARQWPGFARPQVTYTGTSHLSHVSQQSMLGDFARNFLLAFAVIAPILVITLRSWSMGLIGIWVNLFPMLAVFGGIGWLGIPVDVALGMSASIALGIAVDDTTHLMVRFRELGGRWQAPGEALGKAVAECGPAMLHTTLIASAGIFTFWWGELVVVSRFAATITLLLVAALLTDLLLLPALLSLGKRTEPGGPAVNPGGQPDD